MMAYDQRLGWRLKKYQRYRRGAYTFFTNSRGFRDTGHSRGKKEGVTRIMVLGDSYTLGAQVSDDQIFSRLFEEGLKRDAGNGREYEVMNVAVSGWATDQELLYFKYEGARYAPDYLVVMVAPNDVREAYTKGFFRLADGGLREKGPQPVSGSMRFCWFLSNYSCLYQFLQKNVFKTDYGTFPNIGGHFGMYPLIESYRDPDAPLFLKDVPEVVQQARGFFQALLLELKRLCRESGCTLVLAVIPTEMELDFQESEDASYQAGAIAGFVRTIAREQNIPFLDLYSALQDVDDPHRIYLEEGYHLSPQGHIFVAEKLQAFFEAL